MIQRPVLVFLFFLLVAIGANAQDNFREGYIIIAEKDTLKGQINSRIETKNYKSCQFKSEGKETVYLPHQIQGFGFFNGKYYSSGIIKDSFVQSLVVGPLSLYQYKSFYILKKGSDIYQLEPKDIEVNNGGNKAVYEDKKWRRVVAYLISDCLSNPNEIVRRISLQEKSMVRLVSRYNQCKGENFVVFKDSKPWAKLEVGATVGIHQSTLKIYDEFEQQFFYLNDPYQSTNPSIGLIFSILSPRLSERISLQAEVHYFKTSYFSQLVIERSLTEIHNTHINLTTLATPVSFKYSIPYKKFALTFQGGFNMDHHLNRKTKWEVKRILGGQTTSTEERTNPFSMYKTQNGIWVGAGIKKNLSIFNVEASIRYFQLPGYNENFFSMSRMGLNVIISR